MIALAKQGLKDLSPYLDSIVWPEDADNPDVTGGDFEGYLMRVPCFRDANNSIKKVIQSFEAKLKELEKAKKASDLLADVSRTRATGFKGLGGDFDPVVTKPASIHTLPAGPQRKGNYRSSGISERTEKKGESAQ